MVSNRALFIATMRRPEMRNIRAALHNLQYMQYIDWRDITAIDVEPWGYTSPLDESKKVNWTYINLSLRGHRQDCYLHFDVDNPGIEDFELYWVHSDGVECCCCQECQDRLFNQEKRLS